MQALSGFPASGCAALLRPRANNLRTAAHRIAFSSKLPLRRPIGIVSRTLATTGNVAKSGSEQLSRGMEFASPLKVALDKAISRQLEATHVTAALEVEAQEVAQVG